MKNDFFERQALVDEMKNIFTFSFTRKDLERQRKVAADVEAYLRGKNLKTVKKLVVK